MFVLKRAYTHTACNNVSTSTCVSILLRLCFRQRLACLTSALSWINRRSRNCCTGFNYRSMPVPASCCYLPALPNCILMPRPACGARLWNAILVLLMSPGFFLNTLRPAIFIWRSYTLSMRLCNTSHRTFRPNNCCYFATINQQCTNLKSGKLKVLSVLPGFVNSLSYLTPCPLH